MRHRISIRGLVRPSGCWLVGNTFVKIAGFLRILNDYDCVGLGGKEGRGGRTDEEEGPTRRV